MKTKTLKQWEKEHEAKVKRAQKQIEKLLKSSGLTLVAGYNKEKNIISLELIPTELADARNKLAKQAQEILASEGDKISDGDNSQNNPAPETKIPDSGGLATPEK